MQAQSSTLSDDMEPGMIVRPSAATENASAVVVEEKKVEYGMKVPGCDEHSAHRWT